ncbi:MAG TPA: DUF4082 domain-containing protein [Pyrinomonadaceae bacterium]|nr:DUF4082 domain-containing protein [Pyrinomonadaceae bacterium]
MSHASLPSPLRSLRLICFACCLGLLLVAGAPHAPAPTEAKGGDAPPKAGKVTAARGAAPQSGPNVVGQWGPVENLDTVPVHISLLPDGRLLYWGRDKHPVDKWDRGGGCLTYTWHPVTKAKMTIANNTTNLFCSAHSFLPDGRLLVTGGHVRDDSNPSKEGIGEDDVNIFNPADNTWTVAGHMQKGRWYPSNVTLPSGETLVVSGYDNGAASRNDVPDIYTLNGMVKPFTASGSIPAYPYLHLWNNGRVFVAGPGAANASKSFYQYPGGTWNGQFTNVTTPINTHFEGATVTYDGATNKILMVGGRSTTGGLTLAEAETIDLSNSSPFWQATASMSHKRKYHNATVLPDGKVLVTGGTQCGGINDVGCAEGAATVPEMWNPQTGTWTNLAPNPSGIPRAYHSVGLLLPDARVLVGGGGLPAAGGEVVPTATPGVTYTCVDSSAPTNINCRVYGHKDVEIYSPPYLFNSNGTEATRPVINHAPDSISYMQNFTVQVNNPSSITKVSLVRLPSVTHGINYDQRAIFLTALPNGTSSLKVYSPMLSEMAPPGYYMLFLINSSGVPSKAWTLKVEQREGYIDGINCNQIWGWAWDPNNPNAPVNVDILVNDSYAGTVTANLFRQDLLNAGKGNGYHGFVFNLPFYATQGVNSIKAKLSVMPLSEGLNSSPRPVICGASMFPAFFPPGATGVFAGASSWEQSIQFSSAVSGKITHLRYFKAFNEVGSHVGRLWSDDGVLLAQANFTNETSFGWQEAALTTPYTITPGVKYRVSYNVNAYGYGSKIPSAFGPPVVNWPLTAWAGTYSTPAGTFPNTPSNSNFLADVRFSIY